MRCIIRNAAVFFAGLLVFAGCSSKDTTSVSSVGTEYTSFIGSTGAREDDFTKLVWSDEFEGSKLKSKNWTIELLDGSDTGNNESETYVKDNVEVKNGYLHITADTDLNSSRISTEDKKYFQYGRMEARIKFSVGKGSWPAFWMLGQNLSDGVSWPYCGEIDIMEHVNNDNFTMGTLHWNSTGSNPDTDTYAHAEWGKKTNTVIDEDDFKSTRTGWHTYGAVWTDKQIYMYIDSMDNIFYTCGVGDAASGLDAFNRPFFFLVNFAMGGKLTNYYELEEFTKLPWHMYVDYIRVYQDENAEIE